MRKTTAELLTEIAALFPDNNTGLITPAALRTSLDNICDSFTSGFAALRGTPGVAVALTVAPQKLNVFAEVVANSVGFLEADLINNRIVALVDMVATFSVTVSMAGANNSDVQLELRRNGIPTLWLSLVTTIGLNNRVQPSLSGYLILNAGDVMELYANVLAGSDTVDMSGNALILQSVQR